MPKVPEPLRAGLFFIDSMLTCINIAGVSLAAFLFFVSQFHINTVLSQTCEARGNADLWDVGFRWFFVPLGLSLSVLIWMRIEQHCKAQAKPAALLWFLLLEWFDAFETQVSLMEISIRPLGFFLALSFGFWPIVASIAHLCYPKFKRGALPAYNQLPSAPLTCVSKVSEFMYSGLNLASAVQYTLGLCFDLFYDTVHQENYAKENLITNISMLVAFVIGALFSLKPQLWQLNQLIENTNNIVYFCLMVTVSIFYCEDPQNFSAAKWRAVGARNAIVAFFAVLPVVCCSVLYQSLRKASPYSKNYLAKQTGASFPSVTTRCTNSRSENELVTVGADLRSSLLGSSVLGSPLTYT